MLQECRKQEAGRERVCVWVGGKGQLGNERGPCKLAGSTRVWRGASLEEEEEVFMVEVAAQLER